MSRSVIHPFRTGLSYLLPFLAWGGLTVFLFFFVYRYVDFRPRVDQNFFFSSDDPQLRTDRVIDRMFSQEQEIVLSAAGDIHSAKYLRKLQELTDELSGMPGIDSVQSLTKGPRMPEDAPKSPLWSRVLIAKDFKSSFVYVFMQEEAPIEDDIRKIEKIGERLNSADFRLMISGTPYIVELIQRNLLRDLKVFSIAAFCVFGLSGLVISRSLPMVLGTLIASTNASALTLMLTRVFHITVGPLTANLSTIVFVLTLTHMVFMTFNWKHIIDRKESSETRAWSRAVSVTLLPSSLSMVTALLGFLSLLFVPATPLRQLGVSGAMGTVIAFAAAYVIYPFFLRIQTPKTTAAQGETGKVFVVSRFFRMKHGRIAATLLLAAVAASTGLRKLDTEPDLFAYFKKGGEIRNSLEYIDKNGGSTPLHIVLSNPDKAPLKMGEAYPRLWHLQTALEHDPAVGSVVSLTLLLAEVKRSFPISILPVDWTLKLMETRLFGRAALNFITKDGTKTLLVVRMKESYRQSSHLANVDRLKGIIRRDGFEPVMVGGTYLLYGQIAKLVASSLVRGLPLLIFLFVIMGGIISRSFRVTGAMFISLGIIPLLILGILGHLRVPLDIISAPAANIAIGIGVDAMIHLLVWVRRHPAGSMRSWDAWADVCSRLWKPVLYSMCVVCAGFAIFILSGFPPTRRFGFSVVVGTLLSPLPALFVLPWFATGTGRREDMSRSTRENNQRSERSYNIAL